MCTKWVAWARTIIEQHTTMLAAARLKSDVAAVAVHESTIKHARAMLENVV